MYITYDRQVDAVYIKLIPGKHQITTVNVDQDIALNLDDQDRLIGIEVLDASERLDLQYLLPVEAIESSSSKSTSEAGSAMLSESTWFNLKRELEWRKEAGVPVKTVVQGKKNWVKEIHNDEVVLEREDSGKKVVVTRSDIEEFNVQKLKSQRKSAITRALKELASSL